MTKKKNSRKQQKKNRRAAEASRQARQQEAAAAKAEELREEAKAELAEELAEEAREELEDIAANRESRRKEAEKRAEHAKEQKAESSENAESAREQKEPAEGVELAWQKEEMPEERKEGFAAKWKDLWQKFLGLKLWIRIVAIVLVVVLALGLVAYGYFHSKYRLMNISDGKFAGTEVSAEGDSQDELENEELQSREIEEKQAIEATGEIEEDKAVFNILLLGTDDRTTQFNDNARGDTCILLSINRETNQVHLVSFERAIGVKIPSGEYEGQWDWLTHMFWYGGPYLMTRQIRENFKVDVTKYIRVNIRTFMELVDSVGGVDIDMTEAECNNINHPEGTFTAGNIKGMHVENEVQQDLATGINHLNGATAMCYARLRAIDDDWHRVERQRKVILAAVENLKKLSVTELDKLLNNVLPLVQTNLTEGDIASLIPEAATFVNMDYDTTTFPLKHTYGLMDGMCGRKVLALDFETNAEELQNFLYGETTAEELSEKYDSATGEYSYKNSESYKQNYQDAEAAVGKGTYIQKTGKSMPTLVETPSSQGAGTAAAGGIAADGLADQGANAAAGADAAAGTGTASGAGNDAAGASSADAQAAAGTASSLGAVESTTTDPVTGIVTIVYYNEATGVRTAVASNPVNGATTVTAADTGNGTTVTAHSADGVTVDASGAAADSGVVQGQ
ncbi:LCP family protein [Bacillota bacterium HCP28S3_F12]